MSRAPITIFYGGRTWSVRPFTLDQCEEAEAALSGSNNALSMRTSRAILAAALRRDHPQHADTIGELETSPAEVTRA